MNIDPRLMKQLLQLSAIKPLDIYGDSNSQSSYQTDFAQLLSDLLLMTSDTATAEVESDKASTDTVTTNVVHPFMLSNRHYINVANDVSAIVNDAAARYQVDPSLVMAVIQTESSFNPTVVSPAGAKGLMQLMDGTADAMGVDDPFDPVENVNGGVRYLAQLLNKYDGNVQTALAAYNAGPGRLSSLGINNDSELRAKYELLPQETQRYINKVLAAYEAYK